MPAVTEERSEASALRAFREMGRFWRFLLQKTSPSQIFTATGLALFGALSEGLTLVLLIPLLRLLDPAAASAQESKAWLPNVLEFVGIRPNLVGILMIFLGLVAARSVINRQRGLYLSALRLNLLRDIRIK